VLLLIDNYDSFTWNLVHCIQVIDPGLEVRVVRHDEVSADDVVALSPSHVVLSPGPCTPADAGVCPEVVKAVAGKIPLFGVCLGHQVIADVYGMRVMRHDTPVHGKTSHIHHDGRGVYAGLPNPFEATRYHSLIVDRASCSDSFEISSWTEAGEVMGLRWKGGWPTGPAASVTGVQFHPESFMSLRGPDLVRAFLEQPPPTPA